MMSTLKPKEFIKVTLIDDVGSIIKDHPYISFVMMGVGIELLGKCMNTGLRNWDSGGSRQAFENAMLTIPSFQRYRQYLTTHDLYGSFRCGLAHTVRPKHKVTFSSKQEMGHLIESNGRLNLKVEDLYADFKNACEHVIGLNFPANDKMNSVFLQVPGTGFNSGTNIPTGSTSSLDSPTMTLSSMPSATGSTTP